MPAAHMTDVNFLVLLEKTSFGEERCNSLLVGKNKKDHIPAPAKDLVTSNVKVFLFNHLAEEFIYIVGPSSK